MLFFLVWRLNFPLVSIAMGHLLVSLKKQIAAWYKIHLLSNWHAGVIIKAFLSKLGAC